MYSLWKQLYCSIHNSFLNALKLYPAFARKYWRIQAVWLIFDIMWSFQRVALLWFDLIYICTKHLWINAKSISLLLSLIRHIQLSISMPLDWILRKRLENRWIMMFRIRSMEKPLCTKGAILVNTAKAVFIHFLIYLCLHLLLLEISSNLWYIFKPVLVFSCIKCIMIISMNDRSTASHKSFDALIR